MKYKITLVGLMIGLLITCFIQHNYNQAQAHTTEYQLILVNQQKVYCSLMSGRIDTKKHSLRLEYTPYSGDKSEKRYVYIAETNEEFSELKLIGSFQINFDIQKYYGVTNYSNNKLVEGKRYIIWANEEYTANISADKKKSILEKAEAILCEQDRLGNIGAYKENGSKEMILEATFNLVE